MRDAALMQRLGVNAIRVYNVDPTISHDVCMSIFNAAGIYVVRTYLQLMTSGAKRHITRIETAW